MSENPMPDQMRNEPTRTVVDDMMQQTEKALQSSARAAAELNELRRRTDEALDWRKQLSRHPGFQLGLAVAVAVVVYMAFSRKR